MIRRSERRKSIAGGRELVRSEIDGFESSMKRFRGGRVPGAMFLEERLRLGVYGQRQDGVHMMRSKLPLGLIGARQLEAFADLTEAYGHGVAHLTTRQDIQVHFIGLERTPDFMRVLDRADTTSREACGNVVRNVTASPVAGVSPTEAFDVTAHGMALAAFLLRHPDGQSLGRKFKIHLAGCPDTRWNMGAFHDIGLTAVLGARGSQSARGFRVLVGGGLGPVPYEAQLFSEFLPEAELLPFALAVLRVFAERGEKQNRARARLKFLVAKMGIEAFKREVELIRAAFDPDPAWSAHLAVPEAWDETPLHRSGASQPSPSTEAERVWLRTNSMIQRQAGYRTVLIRVPRGDLSPEQLRGLAGLLREHTGDSLRITPEQGLTLRWVPSERLLAVREGLLALGLGAARAGGIDDVVTCPGADTCKLGITSPRALARSILPTLEELGDDARLEQLRIKISGCPNSCAQHQIADIGFYGAARTVGGVASPHYVLMLGGLAGGASAARDGGGFGIPVAKVPAAHVGAALRRLTELFLAESLESESFGAFVRRSGRQRLKQALADLLELPSFEERPEVYREPGSEQEFAIVRGTGECAGEVVDMADLLLVEADRHADLALERLQAGREIELIVAASRDAMLCAARALLSSDRVFDERPEDVLRQFKTRFYDSGRIFEGVGHTLLQALQEPIEEVVGDRRRRLVVETGLFVDEAHSMLTKMRALQTGSTGSSLPAPARSQPQRIAVPEHEGKVG